MAPKIFPLLFIALSIWAVALPNEVAALVGGWKKIEDTKDPEVVKIGKFAITEHNKEAKSDLRFVTVVEGQTQVVAGTNYRLVISAEDGRSGDTSNYLAEVWSQPWQKFLKLTSFNKA